MQNLMKSIRLHVGFCPLSGLYDVRRRTSFPRFPAFFIIADTGARFNFLLFLRKRTSVASHRAGQNNMMVGMPFPGRVETTDFQNLYSPLRIILIGHKKVNIRCLAKLRDRIKPGNSAALQCHRNDSLFRQKGGESCIQYLKLNSFMYCSGCF